MCILAIRCLLWTPNYITADYVFRQHKIGNKDFLAMEIHKTASSQKRHWTWNQHIDLERISQFVYSSIVWWFILNRMSCNNTILSRYCNTNRTDTLSTERHSSLCYWRHIKVKLFYFLYFSSFFLHQYDRKSFNFLFFVINPFFSQFHCLKRHLFRWNYVWHREFDTTSMICRNEIAAML